MNMAEEFSMSTDLHSERQTIFYRGPDVLQETLGWTLNFVT